MDVIILSGWFSTYDVWLNNYWRAIFKISTHQYGRRQANRCHYLIPCYLHTQLYEVSMPVAMCKVGFVSASIWKPKLPMAAQKMFLKESLNFLLMMFSILHDDWSWHYTLENDADSVL